MIHLPTRWRSLLTERLTIELKSLFTNSRFLASTGSFKKAFLTIWSNISIGKCWKANVLPSAVDSMLTCGLSTGAARLVQTVKRPSSTTVLKAETMVKVQNKIPVVFESQILTWNERLFAFFAWKSNVWKKQQNLLCDIMFFSSSRVDSFGKTFQSYRSQHHHCM